MKESEQIKIEYINPIPKLDGIQPDGSYLKTEYLTIEEVLRRFILSEEEFNLLKNYERRK